MNDKESHLLKNYQELMQPHEKIVARWLTEEWNQTDPEMPRWLKTRIWNNFPNRNLNDPNSLARIICLKLLENHKHEISLH